MYKQISSLSALLLCTGIAICQQEAPKIEPVQTVHKRTTLINTSNIEISSILHKNGSTMTDAKIKDDIDKIETVFTKFGPDWATIRLSTLNAVALIACAYYGYHSQVGESAGFAILGILDTYWLYKDIRRNLAQSNEQKMMYKPVHRAILQISREDGKLMASARTGVLSPEATRTLQKSQEELNQLVQEIIANHDETVKDPDLYSSPVFAKLVEDFKASC